MHVVKQRLRLFRRLAALLTDERSATEALAWTENRHKGRLRANYDVRNDLRRIAVGEHARLEVFWKDLPIGHGPAASVFLLNQEILRFDCFGAEAGHMHAAFFVPARGETRLRFREATVDAQIDHAIFEIERNLDYYQARVADPEVRRLQIDRQLLLHATAEAHELMREFARSS